MKWFQSCLSVALALILALAGFPLAMAAEGDLAVLSAPEGLFVTPGGSLVLPLTLKHADALGAQDVAGLQVKLAFDHQLATLESVEAPAGSPFADWTLDYSTDTGVIVMNSSGTGNRVPAEGDLTFANATLRFSEALTPGQQVNIALQMSDLCDEAGQPRTEYAQGSDCAVTVPSVSLAQESLTLQQYDTVQLTADVLPEGADLTWTSSQEAVASVRGGYVTALTPGETVVTASFTMDGVTFSDQCVLTVVEPVLAGLHLAGWYQTVYYLGDSLNTDGLQVILEYTSGALRMLEEGYTVSGFSSEEPGSCTVTVAYGDLSASYDVTVETPAVSLPETMRVYLDAPRTLSPATLPSGLEVTYVSDTPDVLTVEGNVLTAVAPGTAQLTAQAEYQGRTYTAVCQVTVPEITVTDVQLVSHPGEDAVYYLGADLSGEEISLHVTFSDGTTQTVQEDYDLLYNAAVPGEMEVTVVYAGYSNSFRVPLREPTLTLSAQEMDLWLGDGAAGVLTAEADPSDASILWNSSDASLVTVKDGQVTGIREGSAQVSTRMTVNGLRYTAVCRITVHVGAAPEEFKGDLNQDGGLSVADVVLLRRAILSSAGVDVYPMGDMNDDNQLTVADVVLLRRAVLNQ